MTARPATDPTLAANASAADFASDSAAEVPSAGDTPRAFPGPQARGSGILAPAAVGEAGAARSGWEGPDLDTLWHDTDVLEVSTDGELDL